MTVLTLTERVKHNRLDLFPGVALEFEGADFVTYLLNRGLATETPGETPMATYSAEETAVSPDTVYADGPNRGQLVIGSAE